MCTYKLCRFQRIVVAGMLCAALSFANGRPCEAQEEEDGIEVPLRNVVLFTSGVGFFDHSGSVDGEATVEFQFDVEEINDLLKSMVVQDYGDGRVSTVSYESRNPVDKTLKTFAIDLTGNPTLADLLRQVRGERVAVQAPNEMTGTILGVETRKKKVGENEFVEYSVLNLLTEDGLRSVSLDDVSRIELLNEKLDAELRQALAVLAGANATDKKTVAVRFQGDGERRVRVGYIRETPVWKTSYRLVLSDEEKPYLQGWAIVENMTGQEWSNVNLTLVSGRPISFIMDLYEPLYVERPEIVPELYSSLRPQKYQRDLSLGFKQQQMTEELAAPRQSGSRSDGEKRPGSAEADMDLPATGGYGYGGGFGGRAFFDEKLAEAKRTAQSVAQAEEVGELFQYGIDTPVTLERQQSAMLPIASTDVEAEKVSIYNESVHRKHPLHGLRLENTTDLNLMQGPVTVFDDGSYAGDARLGNVAPGEERLISYAMDLDTEVAPEAKSHPEELVSVKIVKGVLYESRKARRSKHYTVKNSAQKPRSVLVEHPVDTNWELVAPEEPDEKTRGVYRFAVDAEPGESTKLTVTEERTRGQSVQLTNINTSQIRIYLRADVIGDEVKQALEKVMDYKQRLSELSGERKRREQRIQSISNEQSRIRQNMARINRGTDLYNRYIKKLTDQEDEIEQLRETIEELQSQEAELQKELDAYLRGLNVE